MSFKPAWLTDFRAALKIFVHGSPNFLTSERSEEVPFFIAAYGPGKGVTAIGGFLGKSCLIFWSRMMKLG